MSVPVFMLNMQDKMYVNVLVLKIPIISSDNAALNMYIYNTNIYVLCPVLMLHTKQGQQCSHHVNVPAQCHAFIQHVCIMISCRLQYTGATYRHLMFQFTLLPSVTEGPNKGTARLHIRIALTMHIILIIAQYLCAISVICYSYYSIVHLCYIGNMLFLLQHRTSVLYR